MAAGISGAERPRSGAALQPTPARFALLCFVANGLRRSSDSSLSHGLFLHPNLFSIL
jgi:hypothetical protein